MMTNKFLTVILLVLSFSISASTLKVGPRAKYRRIEDAVAKAKKNDTILVFPRKNDTAYEKVAVTVSTPGLKIIGAVNKNKGKRIKLSGKGYNYTGAGNVPRAMFQFNRGANGCLLEGFEIFEAHNDSGNGSAVRINEANDVTIRNCEFHHNDMGMMSGGNGTLDTAKNQLIESCFIHHNGNPVKRPDHSHNLYLGGASVTLRFCEISSNQAGQNVKSRAHINIIEYCKIFDSQNREFDLVDAKVTGIPGSDSVLIGNVIKKKPDCSGNKGVIHFGQDGGKGHNGTIYLFNNTIITPYISPVIFLSAPKAKAYMENNIVYDGGNKQNGQMLLQVKGGKDTSKLSGAKNWISAGFADVENNTSLKKKNNFLKQKKKIKFADPENNDFHLKRKSKKITNAGLAAKKLNIPTLPRDTKIITPVLSVEYKDRAASVKRKNDKKLDLGAFEY